MTLKFWQYAMVGILSLGIILYVVLTQVQFNINQTESLPGKVFICFRGITPERGDVVSIQNHPTIYFKDIHFTKRLMGLPGDKIEIHKDTITINVKGDHASKIYDTQTKTVNSCKSNCEPAYHKEVYPIGKLLQKTKEGKPLHPIKNTIIPEGYVFVSTDHPHSFDSRYEEFGLVKQEHISGRCFGLFKENNHAQERDQ